MSLPPLPEPNFIGRDPAEITAAMVADYEAASGKTLHPAQVERLLINQIAYRETLTRIGIQEAAKQNLLYYAAAPVLDYLGQLVGVYRLEAVSAKTTVRLIYPEAVAVDTLIPAGTRISNGSGTMISATTMVGILAAGGTTIDLEAASETPGAAGNGWPAGESAVLLSDLGVSGIAATNLTVSAGGAEAEPDDRLRDRIADAREAFTTAGSRQAYRWHARSADRSIIDVAVVSPGPGVVRLHPLTETGLPSTEVIDAVAAACTDERVRPLCDTVQVLAPVPVDYILAVRITLYVGADAPSALASVTAALTAYKVDRAGGLGRDIIRWQIGAAAQHPGIYDVEIVSPATDLVLAPQEWARCTELSVALAGFSEG